MTNPQYLRFHRGTYYNLRHPDSHNHPGHAVPPLRPHGLHQAHQALLRRRAHGA